MALKGFDNETAPLNEYELTVLLPIMVRSLSTKIGKEKSVTNKYICSRLKAQGFKITDARVRKLVNHIRINNLVSRLIATSDGYYIAETQKELNDYIDSLYGREMAIHQVRMAMQEQNELWLR